MEGAGCRVEGGGLRVEGGGLRAENGGGRLEGVGWRVKEGDRLLCYTNTVCKLSTASAPHASSIVQLTARKSQSQPVGQ